MLNYKTQRVGKGTYWDLSKGQRIDVEQETVLRGDASSTYYRIPASIMLLAGPVIGLFYVISLPFIGIATIVSLATGRVVSGVLSLIGKSLSFVAAGSALWALAKRAEVALKRARMPVRMGRTGSPGQADELADQKREEGPCIHYSIS
jgi:hypothetical protein